MIYIYYLVQNLNNVFNNNINNNYFVIYYLNIHILIYKINVNSKFKKI